MTRDDLFTTIHKALRKGLFDVIVRAGATDWSDDPDVTDFHAQWMPLLELLRSHSRHEDTHIMPLLNGRGPAVTAAMAEQHDDLDGLLEELADRVESACRAHDPAAGLMVYRDLARYAAGYLAHLHYEETEVMPQIWAGCTDEQIAAARAGLMADITPKERGFTLQLLLPAVDPPTRVQMETATTPSAQLPSRSTSNRHVTQVASDRASRADCHR